MAPNKSAQKARQEERRAPKLIENDKHVLIFKGPSSSEIINNFFLDVYQLKKPCSHKLQRFNEIKPFDGTGTNGIDGVRFLCDKQDTSLFLTCSHNKKRPNNVVLGRLFNNELLDMFEFGLTNYASISDNKVNLNLFAKPLLVFNGDGFDNDHELGILKNFFIDFWRQGETDTLPLETIDRVMSFTANQSIIDPVTGAHKRTIYLRVYQNKFTNSAESKMDKRAPPAVNLETVMSVDLELRRVHLGAQEVRKQAMKQPKLPADNIDQGEHVKIRKNVTRDSMGRESGKIYPQREDLNKLSLRKFKGLRKTGEADVHDNDDDFLEE